MKNLILILLILYSPYLLSQNNDANYKIGVRQISLEESKAFLDLNDAEFKQIKGSPYDNEAFVSGSIYQGENLIENNVLLRYNIFSNEIEIKQNSNQNDYNALIKNSEMVIKIGEDVYVLVPFEGVDEKGAYFKIIASGTHLDLYKKSEVTYSPRTFPKTSYDREQPAKFTRTDAYYFMLKNGNFVVMPTKKSKLLKLMKPHDAEIKAFMKENRVNLKNENHLIKLVKFYNSLL